MSIIRITAIAFWTMTRIWWARKLGMRKQTPEMYWAGKSWIETPSFRIGKEFSNNPLGAVKTFKQCLLWIWTRKLNTDRGAATTGVFSGMPTDEQMRLRYLRKAGIHEDVTFMHRLELAAGGNFLENLWLTFVMCCYAPGPMIGCVFSRYRSGYSLMPIEILEAIGMLRILRKGKVRHLHYFHAYEKDANLHTHLLRRMGVRVNKISSESPLSLINRIMISDELSLCMHYQLEEMTYLKESVRVSEVRMWFPESILNYVHCYEFPEVYSRVPTGRLGFYSSGAWVRKAEGHNDYGHGFLEAEPRLIQALASYLRQRPETELLIYVHPHEKLSPERYAEAQAYYASFFEGLRYSVVPSDQRTSECFDQVDLAISVFSTVSFERLFLGFKSAIFPMGIDFPFDGMRIRSITPKTEQELFEVLDRSMLQTREQFMETCGYETPVSGFRPEDFNA